MRQQNWYGNSAKTIIFQLPIHFVKSVQIRSIFWSVFFHIRTEYGEIRSLRVQSECGKIRTKKYSVFWHFSRSDIPGKHNIFVDFASRQFHDSAEWMLEQRIFDYLIEKFWPEIDTFTSRLNKQIQTCASWCPDPESLLINVFIKNWN